MARSRFALEQAVREVLLRHGRNGKPLSLRQAERITGLSPATIGELAKGNARTPESVRRFAEGMDEDISLFLILAGFEPDTGPTKSDDPVAFAGVALTPEEIAILSRFEAALAQLPPGRERALFLERLQHETELIEILRSRTTPQPPA